MRPTQHFRLVGTELAKPNCMSTETSPSTPAVAQWKPEDVGTEIRRTAERVARDGRAEAKRQEAAAGLQQVGEMSRARSIRKKRLLVALLGAFLLVSALNLVGLGVLRSSRPVAWTEESLDRYLREELLFEVESIQLFAAERGRVPRSLEEMGYPQSGDLAYENRGPGKYRITITDSGKSLTYESGMDPVRVFGERIDD